MPETGDDMMGLVSGMDSGNKQAQWAATLTGTLAANRGTHPVRQVYGLGATPPRRLLGPAAGCDRLEARLRPLG